MTRCVRLALLLTLLLVTLGAYAPAGRAAPAPAQGAAAAQPRLVVFEGFYRPT